MAHFTVVRVTHPTDDDYQTSADIFYELMHSDISIISLVGGDKGLIKVLALATLRAGTIAGEYYIARDDDSRRQVGFALWMPPGQDLFSTDEQRKMGLNDFMERLSEEGKAYYKTTYLAKYPQFVAKSLGPTGKLDSWWLNMAFVCPEWEGRGILTTFVSLVRNKVPGENPKKRATLACCTTNDKNIAIYKALGFAHRDSTVMPSPWGEWPIYLFAMEVE